jgi:hypothetical protein
MKRIRKHPSLYLLSMLYLVWLLVETNASKSHSSTSRRIFAWRGGAFPADTTDHNATVEEYVAAMKEKDGQDRQEDGDKHPSESHHSTEESSSAPDPPGEPRRRPSCRWREIVSSSSLSRLRHSDSRCSD